MVLPSKPDGRDRITKSKAGGKRAGPELVIVLALCLIASYFLAVHQTQELMAHHDEQEQLEDGHAHDVPVRKVGTAPLDHEDTFLNTLKSCMPEKGKKCKTYIPEGTTTQRVVLLAPPGDLTHSFFRLLQVVVGRAQRTEKHEIKLFLTPHMAPYGYGKTHGWTKIIRVVPQPLLVGVTNTLRASLSGGQSFHDISVEELKASLRQQVRYHCRLSHIAAHTSMWTLTLEDLMTLSLDDLIENAQRFLGLEHTDIVEEILERQDEGVYDDLVPPEDIASVAMAAFTSGSSMLTHAQLTMKDDLLKVLDEVLEEELRISKNLSAWPCESFWTVGEPSGNPLELSTRIQQISAAMSPNCTAPLTSCFVQRDKCEAKGDGKCSD